MKTKNLNDKECLKVFLELLNDRVRLDTGFVRDPDTGLITHQVVQLTCGEYTTTSKPEPLESAFRLATAEEQGLTIN